VPTNQYYVQKLHLARRCCSRRASRRHRVLHGNKAKRGPKRQRLQLRTGRDFLSEGRARAPKRPRHLSLVPIPVQLPQEHIQELPLACWHAIDKERLNLPCVANVQLQVVLPSFKLVFVLFAHGLG